MRSGILSVFILCILSSTAVAQPPAAPREDKPDVARRLLIGAMAADQITTAIALANDHPELNPIYRWADNDPVKVVAAGTALDVAGTYAWTKFAKAKRPKLYKTGLYVMTAWRGYLAARNLHYYLRARPK